MEEAVAAVVATGEDMMTVVDTEEAVAVSRDGEGWVNGLPRRVDGKRGVPRIHH